MLTITLDLTEIEAKQIEEFLDFGCRSQGLAVAQAAVNLQAKLLAAVNAARAAAANERAINQLEA